MSKSKKNYGKKRKKNNQTNAPAAQLNKMPKGYAYMWYAITAVYAFWMIFIMRRIILVNYETTAEKFVDGYVRKNITGMEGMHWLYPVWVIVSCAALLLFVVYISKILYAEKLTKPIKIICFVTAVAGCAFILWYGFFDYELKGGVNAEFKDKVSYITASMIGLQYPWSFRLWGVLASASIFMNTMYAYRRYDFNSRVGVIMGSIGSAAIFITINCPSVGEQKDFSDPRCLAHWVGALGFAVCCAAPLIIMLFSKAKKEKGRFLGALIVFAGVLIVMLVLLITVGKSAIIENIPMVVAYVLLLILNFTDFFVKKNAPVIEEESFNN